MKSNWLDKCPICLSKLVNPKTIPEFRVFNWKAICTAEPIPHYRIMFAHETIVRAYLIMPDIEVFFYFEDKVCLIVSSNKNWHEERDFNIPWFEPDLSNIPKLINKIKTYIVMS
jgi:hypothetical protein